MLPHLLSNKLHLPPTFCQMGKDWEDSQGHPPYKFYGAFRLRVRQGHWKCHHSIECIIWLPIDVLFIVSVFSTMAPQFFWLSPILWCRPFFVLCPPRCPEIVLVDSECEPYTVYSQRLWRYDQIFAKKSDSHKAPDKVWFLLLCYSNLSIIKRHTVFFRYLTSKMPWPWKPG